MDAVAPAIGANTTIVPLLNGMRHLEALDARFGAEKVVGGLARVRRPRWMAMATSCTPVLSP